MLPLGSSKEKHPVSLSLPMAPLAPSSTVSLPNPSQQGPRLAPYGHYHCPGIAEPLFTTLFGPLMDRSSPEWLQPFRGVIKDHR